MKLEKSLSATAFHVRGGHSLTLGMDVALTAASGYVDGDIILEEGAKQSEGLTCGGTVVRLNSFTDVAETSPYHQGILWAVEKGITNGTTATTFSPANSCTRAQIIFHRHCCGL